VVPLAACDLFVGIGNEPEADVLLLLVFEVVATRWLLLLLLLLDLGCALRNAMTLEFIDRRRLDCRLGGWDVIASAKSRGSVGMVQGGDDEQQSDTLVVVEVVVAVAVEEEEEVMVVAEEVGDCQYNGQAVDGETALQVEH
jgi:hypothetical protein